MIETILELSTFSDNGNPLSIKVTAEENEVLQDGMNIHVLDVVLLVDGNNVGVILFNPTNDTINVSGLSLSVAGYVGCLVACGLGHIVSDILDCRRRGKTSVTDLISCMKKKGHRLSLNLINCAVACLSAAVAP